VVELFWLVAHDSDSAFSIASLRMSAAMCSAVYVCVCECECVRVCVCERETEAECECVCV